MFELFIQLKLHNELDENFDLAINANLNIERKKISFSHFTLKLDELYISWLINILMICPNISTKNIFALKYTM
jgi:hypothetical protein